MKITGGRLNTKVVSKLIILLFRGKAPAEQRTIVSDKKATAFRKEYGDIGNLRAVLPDAVMVALTATAPPNTLAQIKESLGIPVDCSVVHLSPNKPNIR